MKEGRLVLATLPQVSGYEKNRPCLVLRTLPPYGDVLVCGVTSKVENYTEGFDERITVESPDFQGSGLLKDSVIRLGFLAVLPSDRIVGAIGYISTERHRRLLRRLAEHLTACE